MISPFKASYLTIPNCRVNLKHYSVFHHIKASFNQHYFPIGLSDEQAIEAVIKTLINIGSASNESMHTQNVLEEPPAVSSLDKEASFLEFI